MSKIEIPGYLIPQGDITRMDHRDRLVLYKALIDGHNDNNTRLTALEKPLLNPDDILPEHAHRWEPYLLEDGSADDWYKAQIRNKHRVDQPEGSFVCDECGMDHGDGDKYFRSKWDRSFSQHACQSAYCKENTCKLSVKWIDPKAEPKEIIPGNNAFSHQLLDRLNNPKPKPAEPEYPMCSECGCDLEAGKCPACEMRDNFPEPEEPAEPEALKPCLHCDTQVSGAVFTDVQVNAEWYKSVLCPACGAHGPRTDTEAEAVTAWNRRAGSEELIRALEYKTYFYGLLKKAEADNAELTEGRDLWKKSERECTEANKKLEAESASLRADRDSWRRVGEYLGREKGLANGAAAKLETDNAELKAQISQAMPYLEADNCQEAIEIFTPPKESPDE